MKVIPEWKAAWRLLTVQLSTLAIGFGLLPPETQAAMLEAVGVPAHRIAAVLGGLMLAGRLLKQGNDKD